MVDVIPVSDPNTSTMAQRIMQYQAVMQMSAQAPQIYNLAQLHRQMIDVLGVPNAEKLVPIDDDQVPKDPISENMGFLNGSPQKAFIYQDHDAHIAVHTSFLQDPMIAQQMGQNPMAQQMAAAIQAHIASHLAFLYRQKIQEQLGMELPAPDAELPEEAEVQLSQLVAQASTQLMQLNMSKQQQAQNQQNAQDPLIQMQQAELQIKQQQAQTQAQKVQGDLQIKQAELQIKAQQAAAQHQQAQAAQPPQDAAVTPDQVARNHLMDVAQNMQQMEHTQQQHALNLAHAQHEHQTKIHHDNQKHMLDMVTQAQQAREKMDIQKQQADAKAKAMEQPQPGVSE
jgi:hypothetical protein